MLIALDATLELRRGDQVRTLPLEDFFLDYGKQDRRPGEYVRRLLVPKLASNSRFRAYKITKRLDEDISAVLAALCLTVDSGRIGDARVAFGGMAGIPKRAKTVEEKLRGLSLADTGGWRAAAAAVSEDFTPLSDLRAGAGYRSRVAGNLIVKALAEIAGVSPQVTRVVDHRMVAHAAE
jgi:xanthine dehydrogenase small subunit